MTPDSQHPLQHINPHQKDTSGEDLGYAGREQSDRREAEREAMILLAKLVRFHPY